MELLRDGSLTDETDLATLMRNKSAVLLPPDDEAWVDYWAEVAAADGRAILYIGTRTSYARWIRSFLQ